MIWLSLALLWSSLIGLAALLIVGAVRMSDDYRDVRDHDAEIAGLSRCVGRARTFDPAAGSHPAARANSSAGLSAGARHRA